MGPMLVVQDRCGREVQLVWKIMPVAGYVADPDV